MEKILKAEWQKFKNEEGVSFYPEEIPSPYKEVAIRAMQQVKNLNIPAVMVELPTEFEIGNQAVNYAGYKTSASGRRAAFVAGAEWMKQKLAGNDR